MSLRWRWASTLGLVALAAVTVVSVAAGTLTARALHAEVDRTLGQRVDLLTRASFGELNRRLPTRGGGVNLIRALAGPDLEVQLLDRTGDVAVAFHDGVDLPVEAADRAVAVGTSDAVTRTVAVDGDDYRMVTAPLRNGAIQVARDLGPTDVLLGLLNRRLVLVGLGAGVAAAAAGWWLAGRATRPILDLTESTERIARTGDLSQPVPSGGRDEIGRLAGSFTHMIDALGESRRQQHRLVSDAGHELRTPLTGLRTNLEVLKRREDLPAPTRRELVDAALEEVEELGKLVAELVDLATDARLSSEPPSQIDLSDAVSDVAERFRRRLGIDISVEGRGGQVTVRPTQIQRAVANLLDNAAKWNPPTDTVEVRLEGPTVVVRDHGPGIPPDDLPHVFERFYRAVGARTTPGSGLGLAIVSQAVEANGGTVFARNHPDGGAEVGFTLPDDATGFPPEREPG